MILRIFKHSALPCAYGMPVYYCRHYSWLKNSLVVFSLLLIFLAHAVDASISLVSSDARTIYIPSEQIKLKYTVDEASKDYYFTLSKMGYFAKSSRTAVHCSEYTNGLQKIWPDGGGDTMKYGKVTADGTKAGDITITLPNLSQDRYTFLMFKKLDGKVRADGTTSFCVQQPHGDDGGYNLIAQFDISIVNSNTQALGFNGTNEYCMVQPSSNIAPCPVKNSTVGLTVEAWIRCIGDCYEGVIASSVCGFTLSVGNDWRSKWGGDMVGFSGTSRKWSKSSYEYYPWQSPPKGATFALKVGATTYTASVNALVTDGKWHHIAGVIRPGGGVGKAGSMHAIAAFIDGIPGEWVPFEAPSVVSSTDTKIHIGRNASTANKYFSGLISEIRFWNVARTAKEIQEKMFTRNAVATSYTLAETNNDLTCQGTGYGDSVAKPTIAVTPFSPSNVLPITCDTYGKEMLNMQRFSRGTFRVECPTTTALNDAWETWCGLNSRGVIYGDTAKSGYSQNSAICKSGIHAGIFAKGNMDTHNLAIDIEYVNNMSECRDNSCNDHLAASTFNGITSVVITKDNLTGEIPKFFVYAVVNLYTQKRYQTSAMMSNMGVWLEEGEAPNSDAKSQIKISLAAQPVCNGTRENGLCYLMHTEKLSWDVANKKCKDWNGQLAVIRKTSDWPGIFRAIMQGTNTIPTPMWLGCDKTLGDSCDDTTEGTILDLDTGTSGPIMNGTHYKALYTSWRTQCHPLNGKLCKTQLLSPALCEKVITVRVDFTTPYGDDQYNLSYGGQIVQYIEFTSLTWATPKTLNVLQVDDSVVQGSRHALPFIVTIRDVSGNFFNSMSEYVSVHVTADNDTAGFIVSAVSDPRVFENGGNAELLVRLTRNMYTECNDGMYWRQSGSCYKFYAAPEEVKTRAEALQICKGYGGEILVENTEAEHSFIQDILDKLKVIYTGHSTEIWTGINAKSTQTSMINIVNDAETLISQWNPFGCVENGSTCLSLDIAACRAQSICSWGSGGFCVKTQCEGIHLSSDCTVSKTNNNCKWKWDIPNVSTSTGYDSTTKMTPIVRHIDNPGKWRPYNLLSEKKNFVCEKQATLTIDITDTSNTTLDVRVPNELSFSEMTFPLLVYPQVLPFSAHQLNQWIIGGSKMGTPIIGKLNFETYNWAISQILTVVAESDKFVENLVQSIPLKAHILDAPRKDWAWGLPLQSFANLVRFTKIAVVDNGQISDFSTVAVSLKDEPSEWQAKFTTVEEDGARKFNIAINSNGVPAAPVNVKVDIDNLTTCLIGGTTYLDACYKEFCDISVSHSSTERCKSAQCCEFETGPSAGSIPCRGKKINPEVCLASPDVFGYSKSLILPGSRPKDVMSKFQLIPPLGSRKAGVTGQVYGFRFKTRGKTANGGVATEQITIRTTLPLFTGNSNVMTCMFYFFFQFRIYFSYEMLYLTNFF